MIKTLYVLRHNSGSYLKSKAKIFTKDIHEALRSSSEEEAETWKKLVDVSIAWQVTPVSYDTFKGKVVDHEDHGT